MKSRAWTVAASVAALICVFLIAFAVFTSLENERRKNAAPDFTVVDASGKAVELSDIRNKPVVVNLWATWCPYCLEEMSAFESAYKQYGNDVVFMMVDMTGGEETVEKAKAYVESMGYTFPVYYDTEGSVSDTYNVTSLPRTLFINRDGSLYKMHTGMLNAEMLESYIEILLK